LLITLYVVSIRPVERQQQRMAQAMGFQLRGNLIRSQQLLAEAAAVDPWSPEGPIWLADTYRWQLVLIGDDARRRQNWAKWWTIALDRAGSDPAIYRLQGTQQLHLYQRYGRRVDLEAAEKTFQTASQWSPSNQWMIAQLAEIVRELGQEERSNRLAREAWELSELGDNIERQLSRQQINLARHLGASVRNGPVRGPADKALEIPATER